MDFFSLFHSGVEDLQKRAQTLREQENFHKALHPLRKALRKLQKEQDKSRDMTEARLYQQLGKIYILTGDLASAQESIEKSLLLGREGNEQFPLWYSFKLLGDLWLARGQAKLAIETLLNSLEKARDAGEADTAGIFRSLGASYAQMAQYSKAVTFLHQALVAEKVGNSMGVGRSFLRMGYICCLLGQSNRTREYIKSVRKLDLESESQQLRGMTIFLEGILFRTRERYPEAKSCFLRAKKIFKKIRLHRPLLRVDLELGFLHIEERDLSSLRQTIRSIKKRIGGFQAEDVNVAWGYLEAWAEFLAGEHESALEILYAHLTVAKEMGLGELLWQLHYLQGAIYKDLEDIEEAGKCYVEAMETLKNIWSRLDSDLKKDYLKDPRRARVREEVENFYRTV